MEKQDNKIIIFDWGGVVESHREGEYNCNRAISNMIKRFNVTMEEKEIISKYSSCRKDEFGRQIGTVNNIEDIKKWFLRVKKEFELNCEFEEFCEVYEEEHFKVHYYQEVATFAHSLREKCNIGILSNLIWLDKRRIDHQMNLDKFDYVWLSFEIESRKPDQKTYEIVEKDCNILPENILFIDDTMENLLVAEKRGWNICQANGYEFSKIKESVNKFIEE